jgi:peptidoglycan/LPS O-acetylase OafA/YrhL
LTDARKCKSSLTAQTHLSPGNFIPLITDASQKRIHGADALRGIAASCVVLHHLSHLVQLAPNPPLGFVSSHFGLGVPLFFMISAFAMYQAYFDRHDMPGFAKAFLTRRYARLLPLYLFMFVLWSLPPFSLFSVSSLAALPSYWTMTFALIPVYSTGYVPAAWSLGVEMLFYFMFPLMIVLCRTRLSCVVGFVVGLFLAFGMQQTIDKGYSVNVYYHAINPVLFIPCFFAGALVWLQFTQSVRAQNKPQMHMLFAAASLAALAGAWLISGAIFPYFAGHKAIFYGIQIMLFVIPFSILLFGQSAYPSTIFVNPVTRFLGTLSYSIYLLHPFVLLAVTKKIHPLLVGYLPGSPGLVFALNVLVTFAVLIPASMLTYRFIEQPGIRIGSKWAKSIEQQAALPAGRGG